MMTYARATSQSNKRGRGDRGTALVEFAIVLPVLAAVMLGTITGGFALNQKQQITHATREGARYAATIVPDQTFSSGTWAENVRDLVVERSAGDLTTADVCVSLVSGDPGTVVLPIASHSTMSDHSACIPSQSYPVNINDTGLRVQVTASRDAKVEFILGNITAHIRAKATAKSEQPL